MAYDILYAQNYVSLWPLFHMPDLGSKQCWMRHNNCRHHGVLCAFRSNNWPIWTVPHRSVFFRLFITIAENERHRVSRDSQYCEKTDTVDYRDGVCHRSGLRTRPRQLDNLSATDTRTIPASLSIITMALAYIPGGTPYYQIAILILAKMYSNSMIAALNSRMEVVSNSQFGSPPSWNESLKQTESQRGNSAHDLAFRWSDESVSREGLVWISLTFKPPDTLICTLCTPLSTDFYYGHSNLKDSESSSLKVVIALWLLWQI